MPDAVLVQKMIAGIDNSVLLAIPFFIFAGEVMSEGRIARLLSRHDQCVFRRVPGGSRLCVDHVCHGVRLGVRIGAGDRRGARPPDVSVDCAASGFSERFSLGLVVSAAETALLIPPSITLIIYGWMTETSISRLFAGGLAVGIVMGIAFHVLVLIEAWRHGIRSRKARGNGGAEAVKGTAWALGMPVIILGGIYPAVSSRRPRRPRSACSMRCSSKRWCSAP